MAKWGSFQFDEVERMAKSFQKALDERVIERFIQDFLLEMALRALRKIKKRTPVGVYSGRVHFVTSKGKIVEFNASSVKTGGQLRRNWQVGRVERHGNAYVVEIFNNTEYALTYWGI